MKKEESSKSSPRSENDIQWIIKLYQSGLSMREVGLRFGITKQWVEQILKRAGVKTRRFTKTEKFLNSLYKSLEYHNIPKRITEGIKSSPLTEDLLRKLYLEENLSARRLPGGLTLPRSLSEKDCLNFASEKARISRNQPFSSQTKCPGFPLKKKQSAICFDGLFFISRLARPFAPNQPTATDL